MPKETSEDVKVSPVKGDTVITQDPDQGPPSDLFGDMVSKLERNMKDWEQSRFKSADDQSKPASTTEAEDVDATRDSAATDEPAKVDKDAAKPPGGKPASDDQKPDESKTAEVKPDDEIPDLLKNKSRKVQDEFNNLRRIMQTKIEAKQAEILGLKKQLETKQPTDAKPDATQGLIKEIEGLRSEKEKLIEQIERINYEASPRFQQKYGAEFAAIEASVKDAAGEHADKAMALLGMPPSKPRKEALNKILSELEPADIGQLSNAFARMDFVRSARDAELANHKEILRQEESALIAQRAQQEEITKAKRQFMVAEVLKAAEKFEAFQPIDGDTEHNVEVENYKREIAEYINGEVDEVYSAFLPVLAAEGQYLKAKKVPALEEKVKELEQTISKLTGSNPKAKGATKSESTEAKRPEGFVDAFLKNWDDTKHRV